MPRRRLYEEGFPHISISLPPTIFRWLQEKKTTLQRPLSRIIADMLSAFHAVETRGGGEDQAARVAYITMMAAEVTNITNQLQKIYNDPKLSEDLVLAQALIDYFSEEAGRKLPPEEVLPLALLRYRDERKTGGWTIRVKGESYVFKTKWQVTGCLALAMRVAELINRHNEIINKLGSKAPEFKKVIDKLAPLPTQSREADEEENEEEEEEDGEEEEELDIWS